MHSTTMLHSVHPPVQTLDLNLPLPSAEQLDTAIHQLLAEFGFYGLLFAALIAFMALLFGSIVLFLDARRTDPIQAYLRPVPPSPIHRYPKPMVYSPALKPNRLSFRLTPTHKAGSDPVIFPTVRATNT